MMPPLPPTSSRPLLPPAPPQPGAMPGGGGGLLPPPIPGSTPAAPPPLPVHVRPGLQQIVDAARPNRDVVLGQQPGALRAVSPAEQLRKYKARSQSVQQWSKELGAQTQNPDAKYWLDILARFGLDGVVDYVNAMRKLEAGGGSSVGAAKKGRGGLG